MPLGLITVRALHFWSVAILFGGGLFNVLIGTGSVPMGSLILRLAACTAALTGIAWFTLTFIAVTGSTLALVDPQDWGAFATSPFGPPWMIQLVLDVVALALATVGRGSGSAIIGALLAFDQAWLGHAATGSGAIGLVMIATYTIHVLAAFGWIGALTMLCFSLRSPAILGEGLRLISTTGLLAVSAVLASGCLNAAFHMERGSDLWSSSYGRLVLCKATLFALMLLLAAFNRREGRRAVMTTRRVALGVGLETALGILTLVAAAALGLTDPAA